jgi:hypothetical protein
MGSPMYMSPEQAKGVVETDARTDLWSLGVVLYEMLCGRPPHADQTTMNSLLVAICTEPARPVGELAPWVPAGLDAIVRRTLAIRPDERYASAAELRAAIEPLLSQGTTLDETVLSASPPPPSPTHPAGGATVTAAAVPEPAATATPAERTATVAAPTAAPTAVPLPAAIPDASTPPLAHTSPSVAGPRPKRRWRTVAQVLMTSALIAFAVLSAGLPRLIARTTSAVANRLAPDSGLSPSGDVALPSLIDALDIGGCPHNSAVCISECNEGRAASCTTYGGIEEKGEYGRPPDYVEALKYYKRACLGGDAQGCAAKARLDAANPSNAAHDQYQVDWWRKKCQGAEVSGCSMVATMYEQGWKGLPKNLDLAIEALQHGCEGGESADCSRLQQLRAKRASH